MHEDLIGQRFGLLVVLSVSGTHTSVRCDCGVTKELPVSRLNKERSCGCRQGMHRHGHSRRGAASAEYMAWHNMKRRCLYKWHPCYPLYGGRGIRICRRWLGDAGFVNFLADMGTRPTAQHTLDRINNAGHYEPRNCRWATRLEQGQNTRRVRVTPDLVHEIRGRSEHGESGASIARRLGLVKVTVHQIIDRRHWANVP